MRLVHPGLATTDSGSNDRHGIRPGSLLMNTDILVYHIKTPTLYIIVFLILHQFYFETNSITKYKHINILSLQ